MDYNIMRRYYASILSLILVVGLSGACRDRNSVSDSVESTPESASTPGQTISPTPDPTLPPSTRPTPGRASADNDSSSTSQSPLTAVLTAQRADAQINLRSRPTTQSSDQGYGLVGDIVTVLRSTTGEGDFTWYYVKFTDSGAEGWIRGDFVDTSAPVRPTATGSEGFEAEGACSGDLQTRYDSDSYRVFICQLRAGGLRYISQNTETADAFVTDNVTAEGNSYVAQEDGYEYHLNPDEIVIYRVNNGQYTQVDQETIESTLSF